jgi:alkylated DNA repair protein alkB family protein 8
VRHDHLLVPPGLVIIPEWISGDEESQLMAEIDSREWNTKIRRRVQHYGYTFEYSRLDVDKSCPPTSIPDMCAKLLERQELNQEGYNQLTINEYSPGVGIASHCDTHSAFTDVIAVVSLLAPITIDFVSHDALKKVAVVIPSRSLFLMGGESRYGWRHSIASRKSDKDPGTGSLTSRFRRVSLTFRNCSNKICSCNFPTLCDSQGADIIRPRRLKEG